MIFSDYCPTYWSKLEGALHHEMPYCWSIVWPTGHRTLFFIIYNVLFAVSCQFGCAESKSGVCQIVSVEHFFLGQKIQNGRQKRQFSANNIENIELRPQICIEVEYKLVYCGHFDTYIIALSIILIEI